LVLVGETWLSRTIGRHGAECGRISRYPYVCTTLCNTYYVRHSTKVSEPPRLVPNVIDAEAYQNQI
jgi:hypothetical protein